MRVVGTAGHVDHGKSELVRALTGTHPDRLKEEQDRQMTIDLGFAWFTLPNGEPIGIIDVPGHRDFIENMLAGVGGIDAAILVIAADEGVMPQTREHLAILRLLEIPEVVVALSKTDLVEDPSWIDLVAEDISAILEANDFRSVPIIPVSALTRDGIGELIDALMSALAELPVRRDIGRPRLPVDRVFTIAGFGTVVTGTLQDGVFSQGEEIEVLPAGIPGRIRGLQTHKEEVKQAKPGSRVAMNVSGIEVNQIIRGDVISFPKLFHPTQLIDVRFTLLRDIEIALKHNQEVKIFIGSAQRNARVRLIGADQLKPGETGWLQLNLSDPIITVRGDRYILRRPSPSATLGGGFVVEPHPTRKYRRMDQTVLDRFENLAGGVPEEVLAIVIIDMGPMTVRSAIEAAGLTFADGEEAARLMIEKGEILLLDTQDDKGHTANSNVIHKSSWEDICLQMQNKLDKYHSDYPLRIGIPVEEFRSRLDLPTKYAQMAMNLAQEQGVISIIQRWVTSPNFETVLSPAQQNAVDKFIQEAENSGYSPPSVKECRAAIGDDLLQYLLDTKRIVRLSDDVLFTHNQYEQAVDWVISELQSRQLLSVADVRNGLGTTRKYALALMEYLDQIGVTVREGDVRRLV